jgi:uncharacterized protein (UPF0332 family)
MPEAKEHLSQAVHNQRVAPQLEEPAPDWAVTVYYYVAAHVVRAYLSREGKPYGSHKSVAKALSELAKKGDLDESAVKAYFRLRDKSFTARYYCPPIEEMAQKLPEAKQLLKSVVAHFAQKLPELQGYPELAQYLS